MSEIDTADAILHKPSGETWLVAYNDGEGYLCCCGYPCSLAKVADCELKRKATPEQKQSLLMDMAQIRDIHDPRRIYAARALERGTPTPNNPSTCCPH